MIGLSFLYYNKVVYYIKFNIYTYIFNDDSYIINPARDILVLMIIFVYI